MTEQAKTCARLLGWAWREDARGILPNPGEVLVGPDGDGRFVVSVDRSTGSMAGDLAVSWSRLYTFDLATLMLCACLRDVGDLDVGPCPACGVRKRDDLPVQPGRRPIFKRDGKHAGDIVCDACAGPKISRVAGSWGSIGMAMAAADLEGRGLGTPTGRHRVPAWEAVLMATPAMCSACGGSGGVTPSGEPATMDMCQSVCERCGGRGRFPGHEGARAALDRLSARLFEIIGRVNGHGVTMAAWHPDVAGDALLDLGETWAMVLAGCPRLPTWLASWMHGKCAEFDGAGERERGTEWIWAHSEFEAERAALDLHAFSANANIRYVTVHNRRDDGDGTGVNPIRYVRCDLCCGTGSSIGKHVDSIVAYLCLDD